ncbi:Cupredoxin [Phaeosphaeriaceae sp. PMI808]|nr:Cupredoxin [Phaeosphaeriaceae sp. PMI808]
MVAFTSIALAASVFVGCTMAAPANQIRSTGVIHRIFAGFNGLNFEPDNVVAELGDLVEFHFNPKNHSVVQSSFDKPCEPLANGSGVFSGFNFATAQGEAKNVFTFQVQNKEPFWYYCSQVVGNHCQMGMAGVINRNFNSNEQTLAKYKENSKNTVTKQPSADILQSQGGWIQPNMPL